MSIRNEHAKRLVAQEIKQTEPNTKFLFNTFDEDRFYQSIKTQLGVLGLFDLMETLGNLSKKWRIFNVFQNYVNNLPLVIKIDDEVEDLIHYWGVFYDKREADGSKIILPAMEAYPPALVHKQTGKVKFVALQEIKNLREENKNRYKHAKIGRTVSLSNAMIDRKLSKI